MYDVVLLIERALSDVDIRQVGELHDGIDEPVAYHVLVPVVDAAAQLHASVGTLGGHEEIAAASALDLTDVDEMRADAEGLAEVALTTSLDGLRTLGRSAEGETTAREPVDALVAAVATYHAAEVIVLTEPHVVQELLRIDWTSRARRRLDVPTLHLLEHETFDEQSSGGGEGNTVL